MKISFKCDCVSTEGDAFTSFLQVNAEGVSEQDLTEIFYSYLNKISFQNESQLVAFIEDMGTNLSPYGVEVLRSILLRAEREERS